jgi:predicted CoA-binding protein
MRKLETIRKILDETHTIAVVGFSSRPDQPGYTVAAYLQRAGYRIIPVNPNLDQALGERAFPDLKIIGGPVDLVLIFRRPEEVPGIVEAAIAIGTKAIWMQLGIVNEAAAQTARAAGLDVAMNTCMKVEHERLNLDALS